MKKTDYERAAETLKVLGHPVRLEMLAGILKDECNVTQIQSKLGLPQSTISQHLSILRNVGILEARREGTKRCHKVIDNMVIKILKMIAGK